MSITLRDDIDVEAICSSPTDYYYEQLDVDGECADGCGQPFAAGDPFYRVADRLVCRACYRELRERACGGDQ